MWVHLLLHMQPAQPLQASCQCHNTGQQAVLNTQKVNASGRHRNAPFCSGPTDITYCGPGHDRQHAATGAEPMTKPSKPSVPEYLQALAQPQWINGDVRTFDMSVLGKFGVIMADPPWEIHQDLPYGTMADNEMRQMNIRVLQDDGVIFLWVTGTTSIVCLFALCSAFAYSSACSVLFQEYTRCCSSWQMRLAVSTSLQLLCVSQSIAFSE